MASNKYRKIFIETFIERIYENEKINYLFDESLEELKKMAIDKYLDTELSYDAIADDIMKMVTDRRDKYNSEKKEVNQETPIENNSEQELNDMLDDNNKEEENTNVTSMDKPIQFVKNDNINSNNLNIPNQNGNISLFTIGLSILAIVGFILIAMILNVLLK